MEPWRKCSLSEAKAISFTNTWWLGREELFYQLGLRQFGNFPRLKLDPPAPLRPLIALAVDAEQNIELSKLTKPQVVDVRVLHIVFLPAFGSELFFIPSYSQSHISSSLERTC
jgi:DNA mismatch repair protein Mlh1 C-terminus